MKRNWTDIGPGESQRFFAETLMISGGRDNLPLFSCASDRLSCRVPPSENLLVEMQLQPGGYELTSALSNLSFWVTSFPRRRETSAAIWIPACAGMTVNPNFNLDSRLPTSNYLHMEDESAFSAEFFSRFPVRGVHPKDCTLTFPKTWNAGIAKVNRQSD